MRVALQHHIRSAVIAIAVLGTVAFLIPLLQVAQAQEEPTVERLENAQYYWVVYWDYEPGKDDEARELIQEHFYPVDVELGREVILLEVLSSEWDDVALFPVEADEFLYETSPFDVEWQTLLRERVGGAEEATALFEEFNSHVRRTRSDLMLRRMD